MSESFGLDWLRLREPQDLRARSRALARRFGAAVRANAGAGVAALVDLGAGSGANFRALAPLISGNQDWRLVDHDRALLGHQAAEIAQWARGQGYRVTHGSGVVTVTTGDSLWRATSVDLDLARDLANLPLATAHGVTCAALLDLVSAPWLESLAQRIGAVRPPFLAALSVDGRREWRPAEAGDAALAGAFARHQSRDKGFGPALGAAAPAVAAAALERRGYRVTATTSDWKLESSESDLLALLIDQTVAAGSEAEPASGTAFDRWRAARHAALGAGRLGLVVGHVDIFAEADKSPGP